MLKITFLTGEYPPMQGGIADHTAYLAKYIAPLGIESAILISRRWQETKQALNDERQPETTATDPLADSPGRPLVYWPIPNWGWRCWPAIVYFLKGRQPDILHIQYQAAAFDLGGWINWLPWYLKKRGLKTRLVTTFHDLRAPYIFPKAGPFRQKSILALARHSHAVICTNRQDLQTLQTHFSTFRPRPEQVNSYQSTKPKTQSPKPVLSCILSLTKGVVEGSKTQDSQSKIQNPKSKIQNPLLVPLGSNVEPQPPPDFDRAAWRKKYRATTDTLLLAYFGFLNESKGGEELIEALALLRQHGLEAHLLLIGGDVGHADPTNIAYAQRVQDLIDRHALADFVHRTGYTDLAQVSANLLAADVVVMPYRDGVSFRRTTLIAALRHSCPVVSTMPPNPTLIPEIRPGENMLLAPPGDAPALAQAIAPLARDSALRQKLAVGARQLGDLFDWEKIAAETVELYRVVTGNS